MTSFSDEKRTKENVITDTLWVTQLVQLGCSGKVNRSCIIQYRMKHIVYIIGWIKNKIEN